eukprot:1260237-Amorphochlora_amoeboformis.AAC.1
MGTCEGKVRVPIVGHMVLMGHMVPIGPNRSQSVPMGHMVPFGHMIPIGHMIPTDDVVNIDTRVVWCVITLRLLASAFAPIESKMASTAAPSGFSLPPMTASMYAQKTDGTHGPPAAAFLGSDFSSDGVG